MSGQSVEHQVPIAFAGTGAGTAPVTWGQKAILRDMRETGWTHNASGASPLPEGTTVETVAANLGRVMSRHPALRMRLGSDELDQPCQVVSASGDLQLRVVDLADDVDADRFVNDMWMSWLLTPFDLQNDWCLRVAVIRHRGILRYWVWTIHHLVVDAVALSLLVAEIEGRDTASPRDPRTLQLLDLGRWEHSAQARRISDRAMRYWESQLHDVPALTFGQPTHPEGRRGKRYWHGRYHSPAAYLAMLAIAARTRTDTSRVLLAIIAIAIGRVMGVSPLTAKVIVSNRFRPGYAEVIGPLSQNSVVTLDLVGTVDDVVARSRHAILVAAKYGYYDPAQLDELTQRLDRERGYPARVSLRINDRRMRSRRMADQAARDCQVTIEQILEARSRSFVAWDGTVDHLPEQAFFTVEDRDHTVRLQLIFDMACFTEAEVEAILRGIEDVAVAAAFDAAVPTGVAPAVVLA